MTEDSAAIEHFIERIKQLHTHLEAQQLLLARQQDTIAAMTETIRHLATNSKPESPRPRKRPASPRKRTRKPTVPKD